MTRRQVRAAMRRLRDQYQEEEEETGEINLVPYMDIVTNIIIFLLASVVTQLPTGTVTIAGPGAATIAEEKPEQPLNLTVTVGQNGFIVAASGGQLPMIPKLPNNEYDYNALTQELMKVKGIPENAQETKANFNADAWVPYDIVIKTLDAMREDPKGKILFPDIGFAAGIY